MLSELDRALEARDYEAAQAQRRHRLSRGVFDSFRRRQLADPNCHPLRRARLQFRDGLTVAELADRALVSATTINVLERGGQGSDLTWTRLARALDVRRDQIDRSWIK